jgi:hypothetical protein
VRAACFAAWGTSEELIISILGHRDALQRGAIRHTEAYGQELLRSITNEISDDFEVKKLASDRSYDKNSFVPHVRGKPER